MNIKLTNGSITVIDDEDAPLVMSYSSWRIDRNGYAYWQGWHKQIKLHRLLMGSPDSFIDHIDGDKLNNRKSNLRLCSHAENMRNRNKNRNSFSQYKGVSPHHGKWQSRIKINNKSICLGRFSSELDAAIAYNKAAKVHHGDFARLNDL